MNRAEFLAGIGGTAGSAQVAQLQPYTPTLRFALICQPSTRLTCSSLRPVMRR